MLMGKRPCGVSGPGKTTARAAEGPVLYATQTPNTNMNFAIWIKFYYTKSLNINPLRHVFPHRFPKTH